MEEVKENSLTRRKILLVGEYNNAVRELRNTHDEELSQLRNMHERGILALCSRQNNDSDLLYLKHVKELSTLVYEIQRNRRLREEESKMNFHNYDGDYNMSNGKEGMEEILEGIVEEFVQTENSTMETDNFSSQNSLKRKREKERFNKKISNQEKRKKVDDEKEEEVIKIFN